MSKAILFWRPSFFIRDISAFRKDRFCWLLLRACWVDLVRDSMCAMISSRLMERKNMVAKCFYQ